MLKLISGVVSLALTLCSIAYPLCWLFASNSQLTYGLIWLLASLWLIKGLVFPSNYRFFQVFIGLFFVFIAVIGSHELAHWYPALVSGFMLLVFGASLIKPPTFIERIARLKDPHLPAQASSYLRKLTYVWCGFFILNITIVSFSIWGEYWTFWAWYAGAISYVLMGVLFIGEFILRPYLIKIHNKE
ncbi:COG4648 family protein [Psittacicella hinzii]|uniref:Intracellular septation protein A n=1 Tax=Psittacicella hinzii TaxID=2028575 RepID=A0A3A1YQE9_9GAMM|nr:hypothetical protein [Psittacicella hinzii]RIY39716.1 hypothetical protein CKF58_01850 [Psittacicella hinzii]